MKPRIRRTSGAILAIVVCMIAFDIRNAPATGHYNRDSNDSVTFILGEDSEKGNPFYRNAERYYRLDSKDRTELVETEYRSLQEVREYLVENAPRNGRAWRLVNLVSHGNHYTGLSIRVTPGGRRAFSSSILESMGAGELKTLPDRVVDERTQIVLHSCGLGRNASLLNAVKRVFSSQSASPQVEASSNFEYYAVHENAQGITRHEADFWLLTYKMGYRPTDRSLVRRLAEAYPEANIDWREAMARKKPSGIGGVFHHTFEVPMKWVFRYPDKNSIPSLITQAQCLKWVKQNDAILSDLEELGIPAENFNWWMRSIYVRNDDGSLTPALWVKGYVTVFCVLKLLP